jgi:hypothetical protein
MHSARQRIASSRRTVTRRHHRFAVCGLPRTRAPKWVPRDTKKVQRAALVASGALYLALAMCAFVITRYSTFEPVDPMRGAISARYTFDDFANASPR